MNAAGGALWKYATEDSHGELNLVLETGHGELELNPTFQGSMSIRPQGEDAFCLDLTIHEFQTP